VLTPLYRQQTAPLDQIEAGIRPRLQLFREQLINRITLVNTDSSDPTAEQESIDACIHIADCLTLTAMLGGDVTELKKRFEPADQFLIELIEQFCRVTRFYSSPDSGDIQPLFEILAEAYSSQSLTRS
jgi:hypothetical protein